MPVQNSDIADCLNEIADLLEIQDANPFRVRAYRNAARVVGGWPTPLSRVLLEEERPKLPGIGKDLEGKIVQILSGKKLGFLEDLRRKVPEGVRTLLKVPGLGPKRVRALQTRLKVKSLDDLREALDRGTVRELAGFGEKIESNIREELKQELFRKEAGEARRVTLSVAEPVVRSLMEHLQAVADVAEVVAAGSFRRRRETVGDIDLLVSGGESSEVMQRFVDFEDVKKVSVRGTTKSTVILKSGLHIDLRHVARESFGAALHYFTGSKAHNVVVRLMGVRRGLKINEYGIFRKAGRGWRRVGGRTEAEVFRAVGLPFIEPELRENQGEIEAAEAGRLPKLVRVSDIRGDLHAHTRATDGRASLQEMAEGALALGYSYLAITDHSQRLTVARGLTARRLREQMSEIDAMNDSFKGFRILKGIEVDILEDGKLDLPTEVLAELDVLVCSVHSRFGLSITAQTERILRAMDRASRLPGLGILGHPTGRLIGARGPYAVDLERVMRGARERGFYLELNAQPDRLDLDDRACRLAKELRVPIVISTDAHSVQDFASMKYGIDQARRGWLEPEDVLNTYSLAELRRSKRAA